jgi:LAGLIDADG DNA endonuclease family protein
VLHELRDFFAIGSVHRNGRHDNHREDLYCYSVDSRHELLETIIPFFRRYPLRTAKRSDFEKFAWCVEAMQQDRHLTREGLIEILEVAETMNRRVSRREVIGILRGHTSDTRASE